MKVFILFNLIQALISLIWCYNLDFISNSAISSSANSINSSDELFVKNEKLVNNTDYANDNDSCPIRKGTTLDLDSIIVGRCNDFLNVVRKSNCRIQTRNISCQSVWNKFKKAIVNKDPCQVSIESFQEFLSIGRHPIESDRSLFWSGTKNLAHEVSKILNYYTLEDTLIGYIVDDLRFCSSQNESGFSTTHCPEECVTRNNPFWAAASIDFARRASGRALAILNATAARGGAASNYTSFMRFEVPNLVSGQLTELKVILTGTPGEEKFETCSQPKTLQYLEQLLKQKNITYSCQEDTIDWLDTRLMLCFLQSPPFSEKCNMIRDAITGNTTGTQTEDNS